jgi:hypothetical protein
MNLNPFIASSTHIQKPMPNTRAHDSINTSKRKKLRDGIPQQKNRPCVGKKEDFSSRCYDESSSSSFDATQRLHKNMFVWISNFPTEFFLPVNSTQIKSSQRENVERVIWEKPGIFCCLLFFVLEEFRTPTHTYLILHIE